MRDALIDARGLVAVLDRSDAAHERCVDALKRVHGALITVWPALTEAMHLLADTPKATEALCDMAADGTVTLVDLGGRDIARVKELMRKYRDLPMDFADAALVATAERERISQIVSLDRHFDIYRLPRRAKFRVLPGRVRP